MDFGSVCIFYSDGHNKIPEGQLCRSQTPITGSAKDPQGTWNPPNWTLFGKDKIMAKDPLGQIWSINSWRKKLLQGTPREPRAVNGPGGKMCSKRSHKE